MISDCCNWFCFFSLPQIIWSRLEGGWNHAILFWM